MNILLLSGPFFPKKSNNANLLASMIPELTKKHHAHILSAARTKNVSALPAETEGLCAHWCVDERQDFLRRYIYPLQTRILDHGGYSDALNSRLLLDEAKKLRSSFGYDAVISTMEPFPAADCAARLKNVKKILYLMDPPANVSQGRSTPYRDRRLGGILTAQDAILTTPFIRQALREHGFGESDSKIIPVGFPLIGRHDILPQLQEDGRIHLLFTGWLYSDIRSPKYFLDILSRLDERYSVTFMGRECTRLTKRFHIESKAELITMPQQPYETALQAMADADILINIGNSVPVHMPSKTLEYINTGKPIVNFYKMDDCPTLYYTKRYPLCLNLSERDPNVDAAAARFIDFCVNNKGRTADRAWIEAEYADCTPEYIAQKILEALGESKNRACSAEE